MEPEILTLSGFLDPSTCRLVRRAMDEGQVEPAEILDENIAVNDDVRRAAHVEIAPDVLSLLEARFEAVRPRLEQFFDVRLGPREGAGLLRYHSGGFYRRHQDCGDAASWPDAARRSISLVVFLNSSRDMDPAGDFRGGALRLYRTPTNDVLDVHPRAGALVAFPARTSHEVTTVYDGVRDSVVDWYYEP